MHIQELTEILNNDPEGQYVPSFLSPSTLLQVANVSYKEACTHIYSFGFYGCHPKIRDTP